MHVSIGQIHDSGLTYSILIQGICLPYERHRSWWKLILQHKYMRHEYGKSIIRHVVWFYSKTPNCVFEQTSLVQMTFFAPQLWRISNGVYGFLWDGFSTGLFSQRSWVHFTSAGNGVDRVHLSCVLKAWGELICVVCNQQPKSSSQLARLALSRTSLGGYSIVYARSYGQHGCGHIEVVLRYFALYTSSSRMMCLRKNDSTQEAKLWQSISNCDVTRQRGH